MVGPLGLGGVTSTAQEALAHSELCSCGVGGGSGGQAARAAAGETPAEGPGALEGLEGVQGPWTWRVGRELLEGGRVGISSRDS